MYTTRISFDESKFATVLEKIDEISSKRVRNMKNNIMNQLFTVNDLYSYLPTTRTIYIKDRYNSPLALVLITLLEDIRSIIDSDIKDFDIKESISKPLHIFNGIVIGSIAIDKIDLKDIKVVTI